MEKKQKKYIGHKDIEGVYHKIINEIPIHNKYYELFAGSAAIAKKLLYDRTDVKMYLNDLSKECTDKLVNEIPTATVTNNCYISYNAILKRATTDSFVFIDPPYLHSTRPNCTNLYNYEMSDSDHLQLLNDVLQYSCNIMIVHPKCEMYDTALKNWRCIEIKIRYNSKTSIECLYMNYDVPPELHTYSYIGKDCWDRQRIKRKTKSFIQKLENLPLPERTAILNSLNNYFKKQTT